MKKSQKLLITVEDLEYETTFDKLDNKLKRFAVTLFESGKRSHVDLYINKANAQLCIVITYVGATPKDAGKKTILGYDEKEFMQKQYK